MSDSPAHAVDMVIFSVRIVIDIYCYSTKGVIDATASFSF